MHILCLTLFTINIYAFKQTCTHKTPCEFSLFIIISACVMFRCWERLLFFDWMSFCVWWICYMQILSHYVREPHMVWNNVKLRDKTWELHAHIYMWENKLDAVSSLLLLIRILEMLPSALLQSWDWEHSHKQFNY